MCNFDAGAHVHEHGYPRPHVTTQPRRERGAIILSAIIAAFVVFAAALTACHFSKTPVDVIRATWKPVGEVTCLPTSDRVRICTDSRELSYHWVCEDRGTWSCAKVSRR